MLKRCFALTVLRCAFQYAERTTQAAERIESPQAQANAWLFRVVLLNSQGAFTRAIPLCERAVHLYEIHGILFMIPLASMYWGQAPRNAVSLVICPVHFVQKGHESFSERLYLRLAPE